MGEPCDYMSNHIHTPIPFSLERHNRGFKSNVLHGLGALTEMIEIIGKTEMSDHDVARILVENELELRELRWFAMQQLTAVGVQR